MPNAIRRDIMVALSNVLSWLVYLIGFLICLTGLGCWVYQWYLWLKKGIWLSLPAKRYVTVGDTGWAGIDQITTILLDVNIGYPLLVVGLLVMVISLFIGPN